jgi:hypothetical protein
MARRDRGDRDLRAGENRPQQLTLLVRDLLLEFRAQSLLFGRRGSAGARDI